MGSSPWLGVSATYVARFGRVNERLLAEECGRPLPTPAQRIDVMNAGSGVPVGGDRLPPHQRVAPHHVALISDARKRRGGEVSDLAIGASRGQRRIRDGLIAAA
jgi:hypothetical protein